MTPQEAKDTIARRHNQPDWNRLMSNTHSINKIERIMDKVLELYARSKWDDGLRYYENRIRTEYLPEGDRPEFKP